MSTLAAISDNARRRLGLGLGSHTVTLTYASIVDQDTLTVHGIVLTCFTGSAVTEKAQFKKETNAAATGANIADVINAIFDVTTGVSATASSGVVTITGAKSVATSNTSGFDVASSSSQDEPPFTSDIDQWILDGQLWIANMLVDNALTHADVGLFSIFSLTGDGSATEIALPATFMRDSVVRAQIASDAALYRLRRVTLAEMFEIREDNHSFYKVDAADGAKKYYAIADGKMYFSAAPVNGSGKALIYGIKEPQTTKTVECDLPDGLEPLLVDYAVMRAHEQMKRYDMSTALLQSVMTSLQILNVRYSERRS